MKEIIGLIAITHLWINSEPAIWLKRYLGFKEEWYDSFKPKFQALHRLLYCSLCSGFWIGFLASGFDLMSGAIVGTGAEIVNRICNKLI